METTGKHDLPAALVDACVKAGWVSFDAEAPEWECGRKRGMRLSSNSGETCWSMEIFVVNHGSYGQGWCGGVLFTDGDWYIHDRGCLMPTEKNYRSVLRDLIDFFFEDVRAKRALEHILAETREPREERLRSVEVALGEAHEPITTLLKQHPQGDPVEVAQILVELRMAVDPSSWKLLNGLFQKLRCNL